MTTLTKAEVAEGLQKQLGVEKLVAKEVVDRVFEEIRLSLEAGEEIKLSSFGNFELRDKKSRPGRNPKTREPKLIKARRVVTFRTGQKLKRKIEQYQGENEEEPEENK